MKLHLKNRRKWAIGGAVLLLTATPSFALFGIGDIVFDPTSYASLVSQATTALNQLKTIENNVTHFSLKQQWQTTLNALKNANVQEPVWRNEWHEHRAQHQLTYRIVYGVDGFECFGGQQHYDLPEEHAPGSVQLSQLAMIEASDSVSPDCLTAVGQYRGARTQNATATGSLAAQQLDGSNATNSEVEQLNLLNAGRSTEDVGDAVAGRLASLPRFPDDGRQYAAAERCRSGPQHRRSDSAATFDE